MECLRLMGFRKTYFSNFIQSWNSLNEKLKVFCKVT